MDPAQLARAIHDCLPRRPTRTDRKTKVRQSDEYGGAEIIAAELFRRDFEQRHGPDCFFTAQHEYLQTRINGSPALSFVLEMMKEHFRNWASPRNPSREGGFRKPDALCMAADGRRVSLEVLEVKPVGHEQDGVRQMREMLRKLGEGLEEALAAQRTRPGYQPEDFSFAAAEWRPSPAQLVCPLMNPPGTRELTWACFAPTLRRARAEGLAVYELHALSFDGADAAAARIGQDLGGRIRAAWEQHRQPVPGAAAPSWQQQFCAASPADMRALAALGKSLSWDSLAAGLAVALSRSQKAAAAASGRPRTLLESSTPLTLKLGAVTVSEAAIHQALVLAGCVRERA